MQDDGVVVPESLKEQGKGGEFVSLSRGDKRPPTVEGPAEDVNLVGFFSSKELESIGQKIWDRYLADVRTRTPRMLKLKEAMELYASITRPKTFPFHNAANINLPMLTYPLLQVQARLYDMLWPENGKVLYSAPASAEDAPRAAATEKFANSYIRHRMPEMEQGLDDTIAQFCSFGSAFRRTYWDSYEGRVRSDWIPAEDFVAPNWFRCQDPSLRGVPRYTLVHHMTVADLESYGEAGVFENVDGLGSAEKGEAEQRGEIRQVAEKMDGTDGATMDSDDPDQPRMVLEHHCRWRLPSRPNDHVAFDGKWHYVIIWVDEPSKRVFRVVTREEDDPEDLIRYQREKAQVDAQNMMMVEAHRAEMQRLATFATAAQQMGRALPQNLPMPSAPPPVPEPRPVRKREVCFFTHYRAFYSEGFYGLGFSDFLAPLVKAANTLLNQHIDGVTLRNAKPGFISRNLRGARGAIEVRPGKLIEVDAPPEAIERGIKWMDPPLNDPTTMPLIRLILELGEKLYGSADLMTGATSGANRTAKEIQILNAQLMKQISVLARRMKGAFKHELDKIWRCWGVFLPEEPQDQQVVDPSTGQPETLKISRSMFIPNARVTPASDPRMRFEKVEEAQQKMGIVMNNPMLMQNPQALYAATEELLRVHDGERILAAVQPPQPPPPPQPKEPFQEEAGWLRNEDSPVLPPDDDDRHLQMHMMFLQSPQAQMMTKQQREMAENHLRAHQAAGHEKRAQAFMQQQQQQQQQQQAMPGMQPPQMPMPGMGGLQ